MSANFLALGPMVLHAYGYHTPGRRPQMCLVASVLRLGLCSPLPALGGNMGTTF